MKIIFGTSALVLLAMAVGIKAQADTTLYSRVRSLYENSKTPYDLGEKAIKSSASPTLFGKCVWVSEDGTTWRDKGLRAVRFSAKRTENGPIDSPERNSFVTLTNQNFLDTASQLGGVFDGGSLDVDDITSWNLNPACSGESDSLTYKTSASAMASDGSAYLTINRCGSGLEFQRYEHKRSGSYLVIKFTSASAINYGYCRK